MATPPHSPLLRYDSKTKRLEGGANGNNGGDASLETDYVVVASTHIDPKVDAASDSGFEIDQVLYLLYV